MPATTAQPIAYLDAVKLHHPEVIKAKITRPLNQSEILKEVQTLRRNIYGNTCCHLAIKTLDRCKNSPCVVEGLPSTLCEKHAYEAAPVNDSHKNVIGYVGYARMPSSATEVNVLLPKLCLYCGCRERDPIILKGGRSQGCCADHNSRISGMRRVERKHFQHDVSEMDAFVRNRKIPETVDCPCDQKKKRSRANKGKGTSTVDSCKEAAESAPATIPLSPEAPAEVPPPQNHIQGSSTPEAVSPPIPASPSGEKSPVPSAPQELVIRDCDLQLADHLRSLPAGPVKSMILAGKHAMHLPNEQHEKWANLNTMIANIGRQITGPEVAKTFCEINIREDYGRAHIRFEVTWNSSPYDPTQSHM